MNNEELFALINYTPVLQSLLYDCGMLPEQTMENPRELQKTLYIALAYLAGNKDRDNAEKYMCFIEGRGKPRVIHVTRDIADGESIRLSTLDPFHDVHVLKIISTIKASQECPAVVVSPKKAKAPKPVKTEPLLTQAQIDHIKSGGTVSVSFNVQKEPIVVPEKKAPIVIVRKVRVPVLPN